MKMLTPGERASIIARESHIFVRAFSTRVLMAAEKRIATAFLLVLLCSQSLHSFEEISSRINALGIGFVGLIPDPYTDALRNPAYLTRLSRPLFPLTVDPETAYRLGLYINPTPFLSRSMGGAIVTVARESPEPASLKTAFPLEYFSPNNISIPTGTYLPPYDLLRSGRDFLVESTSNVSSFRASFSYAVALNQSLSFGVNVLAAENGFDPRQFSRSSGVSSDYVEDYTQVSYSTLSDRSDNEESVTSLRFGLLNNFSEGTSLDVEVTVSRSNASVFAEGDDLFESLAIYPDSTRVRATLYADRLEIDPLDKDVIEGNLFFHRQNEHGRMSFRVSFFSGDAVKRETQARTRDGEGDLTDFFRQTDTENNAGWTGGLIGVSGSRAWKDGKLDFTMAGFYGFMRARNMRIMQEEEGVLAKSYYTVHQKDWWDTHFAQINLGTEYKFTPSISALLGARATGIFMNSHWDWSSLAVAEGFSETSEAQWSGLDFKMNAGITGGAAFRLSERLNLSLYTPDLASLSSWHLESLISF